MTFQLSVEKTISISDAYRSGLQALTKADRGRIVASGPRTISGSIDLDAALKHVFPNAARWDYGIGLREGSRKPERVIWVEVHPASSDGDITDVTNKLNWLLSWLSGDGIRFDKLKREFVWVSTGRTSFTAVSPQLRRLASRGLRVAGRRLELNKPLKNFSV